MLSLKSILAALKTINSIINVIPDKVTIFNIEILASQDRDGFFGIRTNFDGPDLYLLNKPTKDIGGIFNPKYTENGIEPYIPLVDCDEVDYEANDVVDCAALWLEKLWKEAESHKVKIPIYIVGHDEYGTVTPIELNDGK